MPQHPFNWQIKAPVCSDGAGAFSLIRLSPLSWFIYAYPHSPVCPSIYFFVLSLQQLLPSLAVVEACYGNNLHAISRRKEFSLKIFFFSPTKMFWENQWLLFIFLQENCMMCGWCGALSSVRAVRSNKLHKTADMINCIKRREFWAGVTMEATMSWAPLLNSPLAWEPEHQVLATGIFLMASAKPNWFASPDCMVLSHRFCEGWQCNNIIWKMLRTATVLLDGSKASSGGTSILKWCKELPSSFSPPCHAGTNLCIECLRVARFCPCCPVMLWVHPSPQCSVASFIPRHVYMFLTAASRFVCCHNTHCI